MKKLTADKCKEQIAEWERMMSASDIAVMVERHLQAYRIALPILEQQERGDGWIDWGGGVMPVNRLVMIEPKLRTGSIISPEIASYWDWKQSGGHNDIIAYRIIPEQPTNQNGEQ